MNDANDAQDNAILAEASPRTVKELRSVLTGAGIEAHIVRPPTARITRGTKYWLAVASNDAARAVQALREAWYNNASDEERAAESAVNDHNASEITCPACGTTFAPGTPECPDCGLGVI